MKRLSQRIDRRGRTRFACRAASVMALLALPLASTFARAASLEWVGSIGGKRTVCAAANGRAYGLEGENFVVWEVAAGAPAREVGRLRLEQGVCGVVVKPPFACVLIHARHALVIDATDPAKPRLARELQDLAATASLVDLGDAIAIGSDYHMPKDFSTFEASELATVDSKSADSKTERSVSILWLEYSEEESVWNVEHQGFGTIPNDLPEKLAGVVEIGPQGVSFRPGATKLESDDDEPRLTFVAPPSDGAIEPKWLLRAQDIPSGKTVIIQRRFLWQAPTYFLMSRDQIRRVNPQSEHAESGRALFHQTSEGRAAAAEIDRALPTIGAAKGICVQGGSLFVQTPAGIYAFDVSIPAAPLRMPWGRFENPACPMPSVGPSIAEHQIRFSDGEWAGGGLARARIWKGEAPEEPFLDAEEPSPQGKAGDEDDGSRPLAELEHTTEGYSRWLGVASGFCFLALDDAYRWFVPDDRKLAVFSVADPAKPYLIGDAEGVGPAEDVAVHGDYLYVACGENGIAILRLKRD